MWYSYRNLPMTQTIRTFLILLTIINQYLNHYQHRLAPLEKGTMFLGFVRCLVYRKIIVQ